MPFSVDENGQRYETSADAERPPVPIADLDGIDIENLTPWQHRLVMAAKGWRTEFRTQSYGWGEGKFGVGLWATHDSWHGRLTEVKLHVHARLGEKPWRDPAALSELMTRLSLTLHRRCDEAWDKFPDSVPGYDATKGEFYVHESETRRFHQFETPERHVVRPERARPTEALPGWPNYPSMAEFLAADVGGEAVWSHIAEFCEPGITDWADSLDYFGNPYRGHLEREWHIKFDHPVHRWEGERVDLKQIRGLKATTCDMTSFGYCNLAASVTRTLQHWQSVYATRPGEMPPGLRKAPPPQPYVELDEEDEDVVRSPAP